MESARSNQGIATKPCQTLEYAFRLVVATAVAPVLAGCVAIGGETVRPPANGTEAPGLESDALAQAAARAVAECGEGRVASVRVKAASGGGAGGLATPEVDLVCRGEEFDRDTLHSLANETCGEGKVAGTTVQYDRRLGGGLRSVGFQCAKEGS